jgi:hypothetical protein
MSFNLQGAEIEGRRSIQYRWVRLQAYLFPNYQVMERENNRNGCLAISRCGQDHWALLVMR